MNSKYRQQGITLVTALVMLVVMMLLAVSAINSSTSNLRIVSNMQIKEESVAAAQQGIEQVISNNFTAAPASSTLAVPMGGTTYNVNIAQPACTNSTPLANNTPNIPPQCVSSSTLQNTGIFFASGAASTGTSWCSAQQWDVQATVVDGRTGASSTVHQGVSLDVPTGTGC